MSKVEAIVSGSLNETLILRDELTLCNWAADRISVVKVNALERVSLIIQTIGVTSLKNLFEYCGLILEYFQLILTPNYITVFCLDAIDAASGVFQD